MLLKNTFSPLFVFRFPSNLVISPSFPPIFTSLKSSVIWKSSIEFENPLMLISNDFLKSEKDLVALGLNRTWIFGE